MTFVVREAESPSTHAFRAPDALELLDWKRRIFALYEHVRAEPDPEAAWKMWRQVREELYPTHPQSPLPPGGREAYGDAFFPYDPAFRLTAELVDAPPGPIPI